MKRKIYRLLVLFLLGGLQASAQKSGYHYEAPIALVDSSGFYNIALTPGINKYLKTDYSDLRVVNDSGKWVPHLVRYLNDEVTRDAMVWDRKIISNSTTASATEVIVQVADSNISNISFSLKNAVTDRYCTLTGSDDLNAWFIINDSIRIVTETAGAESAGSFKLSFPPVSYQYLKIKIYNNGKAPLNIQRAFSTGLVDGQLKYFADIENPACSIIQTDSNKVSYIQVTQAAAYHFEKIALRLSAVKYYSRTAEIYLPNTADHSIKKPGQLVASFNISNNSTLQFNLPESNATSFYILIRNDDNLPLKVEAVKTLVKYRVASVYLEKSTPYQLLLDNAQASAARYDLQLTDLKLRPNFPLVSVGNIVAIPGAEVVAASKENSTKLIWFSLGIAVIVLGFFTYRLIIDMNKKDPTI